MALFQALIHNKQQEFRGSDELVDGVSAPKEAVASSTRPQDLSPEEYFKQSSLQLALWTKNLSLRLFKDDSQLMGESEPNYDKPGVLWAIIQAKDITANFDALPYDSRIGLEIKQLTLRETCRLNCEVFVVPEPS